MMRPYQILILIFILQSTPALACECAPLEDHDKLIEASYSYYEDIFHELDEKAEEQKMKEYEDKERRRLLYEIEELRKK